MTKSFKVEYVPASLSTPIDITDYVITLDKMQIQSGGRISTASLTLNSEAGRFTSVVSTTAPIINKFDVLKITVLDRDNNARHSRMYEVVTDTSQFGRTAGRILPIELEGCERNLAGVPFSGLFRHASHVEMINEIVLAYNAQKSTLALNQPLITVTRNDMSNINPNIWDFTYVDNCFDAITQVVENAGLPVSTGGLGDRFSVVFEDGQAGFLNMMIVSQGKRKNTRIPILRESVTYPIMSIQRTKQASTGTIAMIRGHPGTGTMPSNFATFRDKLEFWRAIQYYDSTTTYPVGAYVRNNNKTYRAIASVTPNNEPPTSAWQEIDVGDFIGTMDYSPWTKNRRKEILNGFCAPEGGFDPDSHSSTSIMDSNGFINDVNVHREIVLMRTNTSSITDTFKRKYRTDFREQGVPVNRWLHGTSVLVDRGLGPMQGEFVGTDVNGRRYENNIARYVRNGDTGQWIVTHVTEEFDLVGVYSEGRTYEWNVPFTASTPTNPNRNVRGGVNRKSAVFTKASKTRGGNPSGTFAWRDVTNEFLGNECFHHPISVSQVDGLVPTFEPHTLTHLNDPSGTPYKKNSGIEIQFGFAGEQHTPAERDVWNQIAQGIETIARIVESLIESLIAAFFTPRYANLGWWFCFPAPFPFSRHNDITTEIGSIFGGRTHQTLNTHRFWDMFNIRQTPGGYLGFSHSDSKELSEITGIQFLFKFDITVGGNRLPWTGDIPFSFWVVDVHGTTWKSEKIIYRHLGDVQQISVNFSDFRPVYRARTSFGFSNILDQITLPEIEVNEELFKDEILYMGFQCEASYDDAGRYSPNWWEHIVKPWYFDLFAGATGDVRFIGTLDGLAFTKAPLAISKRNTVNAGRRIFTSIQNRPNILNTEQLQRAADSQAEIEQFQYEQYTVKQPDITDLDLEDSVYLKDTMIDERQAPAVTGTIPNTLLLAVREIRYSSTPNGGLIRDVTLVRKIE